MKRLLLLPLLALCCLGTLFSCKKDNHTSPEAPFVSDTAFTQVKDDIGTGNGWIMGMALHPATGIIYIYQERIGGKGFYIHAYNTNTQSYATVYENTDNNWSNSNGSEGARIRVDGNRLWIAGGFTNNHVLCLNGLDNQQPQLEQDIPVESPYDLAFTDNIVYVASSTKGIVAISRSTGQQTSYPFAQGEDGISHNSSIYTVNSNGTTRLAVITGTRLQLRSLTNDFIKSVNITAGSVIQVDSRNRIYLMEQDKIVRYAADLSSSEDIPATNARGDHPTYGFVLQEENDFIRVYYKNSGNLYSMRIAP